ncbi:NADP-dependent oxidoreductase domain-containing protein [Apodospora peruviana]|uniref:NADP-dependent oxidoreductase domain-containing protein n=1 Tax=Apodospora peruviana TaxID=516989 RepID=A0AAE0IQE9_9PEZI|nr:NADP-dependent oxidoreductase domain-containing protein [Apodospora peruviana]
MAPIPNIKLSSGYDMPQVGFGLWKVDNAVASDVVYNAIKAGYRLFDGACDYGNEVECGQGVARAIKDGLVKREELFIVSKLWNTFHDGDRVEPIVRKQLADWGLEYFDLYLIHFPVALKYVDPSVRYPPGWQYEGDEVIRSKATIQETWTAFESLVEKKLTKSIGVSNFQAQLIYDLLRYAKIPPATLQIEHHPFLVQQELLNLCKQEGIAVTAYSSFGPASFLEFNMDHAVKLTPLMEDTTIKSIAEKHGKTASQVLLRWATQRGLAVIPKSTSEDRMKANLACTDFDLSEEEIKTISGFNRGIRFNQPSNYFPTELLWIFG